jgi:hypothetical protein
VTTSPEQHFNEKGFEQMVGEARWQKLESRIKAHSIVEIKNIPKIVVNTPWPPYSCGNGE